jgi:diguanylate cyclase (GGDEF)-like protein
MQAVPGFRLLAELHQGQTSLVYRAVREQDGLPVVLKIHRNEFPTAAEIARFEREYRVASPLRLRHGVRLLQLIDIGHRRALIYEDDGCFSLKRLIGGRALPLDQWLDLAVRMASALAELQANRLVHGDVNPNNILQHPETGEIKLTDFELVHQVSDPDASLSLGTLAYIAPEQTGRVKARPDHRSDLYALGATLFELASGLQPFPGLDDAALIHAHLAVVPPSLNSLRPDLPPVIDNLIQRLLAKSPPDRYQTATGLRADLDLLRQQHRDGKAPDMALGQRDFAAALKLSGKLYGRAQALDALESAFKTARDHSSFQWLLLSGPAGIGKSSLLDQLEEIDDNIQVCRGVCAAGGVKPYAPLIDALESLIQRWLSLPEARLTGLRRSLLEALGSSASALVSVLPALGRLLGPLPETMAVNASTAQTRLELAGRAFLDFAMAQQAPLVLVIDDLQWADAATLEFLASVISEQSGSCLLVTTERDERSEYLERWHERVEGGGIPAERIELELLDENELGELVDDALALSGEQRGRLVGLLKEKTLGNPFFVRQVLAQWADSSDLHLDAEGRWQIEFDRIARQEVADNVLDLLVIRVRSLPEAWQEMLSAAACIGSRFEANHLARLVDSDQLHEILIALADQNLLRAHQAEGRLEYAFVHDRVREAVLAELDQKRRSGWHLAIARQLVADEESNVFAVVAQYNRALELLETDSERKRVSRLNARAAVEARGQAAFSAALGFARHALAQWPESAKVEDPEFELRLQLLLADNQASCGELEEATASFEAALDMCKDPIARAGVIERLADALQSQGNPVLALKEIDRALDLLGVELHLEDSDRISATQEQLFAKLVHAETLARIDQLPEADEQAARISRLYDKTIIAVYFSRPALLGYVTARAVEHVLKTGLTPEAGLIFGWWSMVLCMQHQYREGETYARLPRLVHERFGNDYYGGAGRMVATAMALSWTRPYREVFVEAGKAADLLHHSGNLQFASYALIVQHISTVIEASNLKSMLESCERWGEYCRQHVPLELGQARVRDYCIRRLMGRATETLDCDAIVDAYEVQNNLTDVCESLVEMARAAWVEEDHARALDCCERAEPAFQAGAAGSLLLNYGHAVIYSICLARASARTEGRESEVFAQRAEQVAGRVFRVTELAPDNFLAYDRLVAAELAAMRGERETAMAACLTAVGHARQHQQTLLQAQAMRTLVHLLRHDNLDLAQSMAREASQLFQQAGCLTMSARHQDDSSEPIKRSASEPGVSANLPGVDLASIIKANAVISAEIDYDRLLLRLMEVTVENAGAQQAVLVMQGQPPRVIASSLDGKLDEPLEGSLRCPEQMISYVLRSALPVILEDGSRRSIYRDDAYFLDRKVLSVMAVPILRKTEVVGAVYLENNMVAGAFDHHRLQMIQHLLGTAAIALENATLYQEQKRYAHQLEARVRQRTRELEQANAVLTRLAELDGLTQISNRRAFDRHADKWLESGHALSLVLCDVDDFKAYNDQYGHMAGDDVLRQVAAVLDELDLNDQGLAARYGGEEFAVLIRGLSKEQVLEIAHQCREKVLALRLPHSAARATDCISLSVGVAVNGRDLDDLFKRADRALYAAKSAGRNRVVVEPGHPD